MGMLLFTCVLKKALLPAPVFFPNRVRKVSLTGQLRKYSFISMQNHLKLKSNLGEGVC